MNSQQWEVFETPDQVALEDSGSDPIASVESTTRNDDIDTNPLPEPEKAFEVFCGKRFIPSRDTDEKLLRTTRVAQPDEFETPHERYNRLRAEVDSLVDDLGLLADEATSDGQDSMRPFEQLATLVKSLQTELSHVPDDPKFATLLENTPMQGTTQETRGLTEQVQSQLALAIAGEPSVSTDANDRESNAKLELYYNADTATASTQARIASLEERIAKVEKVIGLSDSGTIAPLPIAGTSLVDMVSHLETKLSLLDPNTLSAVSRKVSTLGAEIDLLQVKHQDANHDVVSSQLDAMLEKLERCDGVAQTLPVLVNRLKSLQGLHGEASLFGGRLKQVESTFGSIEDMISKDTELLQNVQTGMAENLSAMQENIKMISERMEALGKTS